MTVKLIEAAFCAVADPFEPQDHTLPFKERVEWFVDQFADDPRFSLGWGSIMGTDREIIAATVTYRGAKYHVFQVPEPIRLGGFAKYRYEVEAGDPRK